MPSYLQSFLLAFIRYFLCFLSFIHSFIPPFFQSTILSLACWHTHSLFICTFMKHLLSKALPGVRWGPRLCPLPGTRLKASPYQAVVPHFFFQSSHFPLSFCLDLHGVSSGIEGPRTVPGWVWAPHSFVTTRSWGVGTLFSASPC